MKYKAYFFDLDGVAYEGPNVIETCRVFVNQLMEQNIQVCFLTNNSSRTPQMVADHLIALGYHINVDNIVTSAQVTANYLKKKNFKRAYVIGMEGIRRELTSIGIEIVENDADLVICGLDLNVTYKKLTEASQEVMKGATFISTNSDIKLSTSDGIAPGNGSITRVIEQTTGVTPIYMGKPELAMFEYGLEKVNLSKEEVVMVGDNYYTDILGAHLFGIDSIFVETGVMTKEEILACPNQPTFIVKDLSYFN